MHSVKAGASASRTYTAAALITPLNCPVLGSTGYRWSAPRPGAATSAGTLHPPAYMRSPRGAPRDRRDGLAAWGALGADDDGEASRFCVLRGLRGEG